MADANGDEDDEADEGPAPNTDGRGAPNADPVDGAGETDRAASPNENAGLLVDDDGGGGEAEAFALAEAKLNPVEAGLLVLEPNEKPVAGAARPNVAVGPANEPNALGAAGAGAAAGTGATVAEVDGGGGGVLGLGGQGLGDSLGAAGAATGVVEPESRSANATRPMAHRTRQMQTVWPASQTAWSRAQAQRTQAWPAPA